MQSEYIFTAVQALERSRSVIDQANQKVQETQDALRASRNCLENCSIPYIADQVVRG